MFKAEFLSCMYRLAMRMEHPFMSYLTLVTMGLKDINWGRLKLSGGINTCEK